MSRVLSDNINSIPEVVCFMYLFQMQLYLTQERRKLGGGDLDHWNDKFKVSSILQITTEVDTLVEHQLLREELLLNKKTNFKTTGRSKKFAISTGIFCFSLKIRQPAINFTLWVISILCPVICAHKLMWRLNFLGAWALTVVMKFKCVGLQRIVKFPRWFEVCRFFRV
jgi:hypothetical protein